jgi:hypothetical protein
MTASEADLWHIGAFAFPTIAFLFPLIAALVVWTLATACGRYRWARLPLLFLPVSLGAYLAYDGLSAPSGYAADYAFGGAWVLAGITAIGSLLLMPLKSTRRAGVLGLTAAAILLLSFYVVFLVGYRLGLYDWWGDKLVPVSVN